jgi:hypothetical protein
MPHCLANRATGEVLGMVSGTAAGLHDAAIIAISLALAFIFGCAPAMRDVLRARPPGPWKSVAGAARVGRLHHAVRRQLPVLRRHHGGRLPRCALQGDPGLRSGAVWGVCRVGRPWTAVRIDEDRRGPTRTDAARSQRTPPIRFIPDDYICDILLHCVRLRHKHTTLKRVGRCRDGGGSQ